MEVFAFSLLWLYTLLLSNNRLGNMKEKLYIYSYGRDEIGSRGKFRVYILRVRVPSTINFT